MDYLRHALRTLRGSPGFTLVVIATLGLGIGINTAIFSLVNGVLLRPLPYAEPERVMTVWESNPQLDILQDQVSAGTYRDWAERASSFADIGAYSFETLVVGGTDEPEQISGAQVSPSVFDVVGDAVGEKLLGTRQVEIHVRLRPTPLGLAWLRGLRACVNVEAPARPRRRFSA